MIERRIPKDITKYESSQVLGLTTRQLIFTAPALALGFLSYYLICVKWGMDINVMIPVCLMVMLPFIIFGWVKPYGMRMEQYIGKALKNIFSDEPHRKYKENNAWTPVYAEMKQPEFRLTKSEKELAKNGKKRKKG